MFFPFFWEQYSWQQILHHWKLHLVPLNWNCVCYTKCICGLNPSKSCLDLKLLDQNPTFDCNIFMWSMVKLMTARDPDLVAAKENQINTFPPPCLTVGRYVYVPIICLKITKDTVSGVTLSISSTSYVALMVACLA